MSILIVNSYFVKNILILILTTLVFEFSSPMAHAQSFLDGSILKGRCIDDSTGAGIAWVNIFNESQRISGNAKDEGEFLIEAKTGDTLVFSAVGYLSSVIIVQEFFYSKKNIIKLEPRTYQIREATIKSIRKYAQFKQDFVDLELKQTALDSVSEDINIKAKEVARKAEYDRMVEEVFAREKGTLFVLSSSIKSKKTKQRKALKKIKLTKKDQEIINEKFNKEIVHQYTHLDGEKLNNFMIFCDFDSNFLLQASEYDIAVKIMKKLEAYEAKTN